MKFLKDFNEANEALELTHKNQKTELNYTQYKQILALLGCISTSSNTESTETSLSYEMWTILCCIRNLESPQRISISDLKAYLLVVLRLELGQNIVTEIPSFVKGSLDKIEIDTIQATRLKKQFDYFYFSRLEFLRNKGHLKDRSPIKDFNLKHWRRVHKERKSSPLLQSKELKKEAAKLLLESDQSGVFLNRKKCHKFGEPSPTYASAYKNEQLRNRSGEVQHNS